MIKQEFLHEQKRFISKVDSKIKFAVDLKTTYRDKKNLDFLQRVDGFKNFSVGELAKIPAVLKDFIVFAEEKWKIASDTQGSGNTANIGSIKCIENKTVRVSTV